MTFEATRANLQRRGLLDASYRLTPAGDAYYEALLAELPTRKARPCPPGKPRVQWSRAASRRKGA